MLDFAQQRVGQTLNDKYRLEQLLGVGGMAAVYRAVHRNGNRVAIKILHPHLALNGNIRERFKREGYVANKVDHPGSVRVLDDDAISDGSVFLVMELLHGETLDARAERAGRRLPPEEVVALSLQLLEVVAAAHAAGIVHRDLKPENLFLTTSGQLKVLDFGIARLRDPENQSHTKTGNTMGTPAFMPPEQALGRTRDVDAQSDVWAIGATMYTLLSGHYVHEAETAEEMRVYAGSRAAGSLARVAPHLSPALVHVVDRALAFDKRQRWPNATAMREALLTAAHARAAAPTADAAYAPPSYAGPSYGAPSYAPAARIPSRPAPGAYPPPVQASGGPPVPATQLAGAAPVRRDPTGRSTTVPVSSEGGAKGRTRALSWVGAGVALLAFTGATVAHYWPKPRAVSATDVSAAAAPGAHVAPAATVIDSPPIAVPPADVAQPAIAAPTLSVSDPPAATPVKNATDAGRAPRPKHVAQGRTPTAGTNCDPNYTLDEQGQKHFKHECFLNSRSP